MKQFPKISIIIPVYNTEDYIFICINSVQNQIYKNLEIICIDDGSTDKSVEIIKNLMLDDNRIKLIQIENHGQGFARNLGLQNATGDYVLFLDSDDFIEKYTLSVCVEKIINENPDFVIFDYRYYQPLGRKNTYTSDDLFYKFKNLYEDNCLELLKSKVLYTVNKLYNKKFLEENQIRYSEGYLYEDVIFMIKAIIFARKVSVIHSPLYRITINKKSSTQTKHTTDIHYKSFIYALTNSIKFLNDKNVKDERLYYLYLNLFKKFLNYYSVRTPYNYKNIFAKEFVNAYSKVNISKDLKKSKFLSVCFEYNIFKDNRVWIFKLLLLYVTFMKPLIRKTKRRIIMDSKSFIKKAFAKLNLLKNQYYYKKEVVKSIFDEVILFMGFDHRYTGNSRYLFEEMLQMDLKGKKIFFVTDDSRVPLENRISPYSERCEKFIARSKIIIFESWIPNRYIKRSNTKWIQLWHGTPIKRMLFDSNEKCIVEKNPKHKKNKYLDILRWDYLITDNFNANKFFNTAFLFDNNKILSCGYPRVKYLIRKKNDENYKNNLKKLIGIPQNKKIVLYVPTWRDYNFGKNDKQYNLNYLIDLNELKIKLGYDYEILYKDHPFISAPENIDFKNYANVETQELLLIADYLITDYSSIVFDALAINIPIILYCNDFRYNQEVRGVYEEIWEELKPYLCVKTEEVATLIFSYKYNENYKYLKDKYSFREKENFNLSEFIIGL